MLRGFAGFLRGALTDKARMRLSFIRSGQHRRICTAMSAQIRLCCTDRSRETGEWSRAVTGRDWPIEPSDKPVVNRDEFPLDAAPLSKWKTKMVYIGRAAQRTAPRRPAPPRAQQPTPMRVYVNRTMYCIPL